MPSSLREFGVIKLATPCSAKWSEMTGDERTRHCAQCKLNVYNVENLGADEVRSLVMKAEGRTCFRFLVRKDGTLLTNDCPVGLAAVRRKLYLGFAAAVLFAMGFVSTLLGAMGQGGKSCATTGTSTLGRIVQRLDLKANVIRSIVKPSREHMAGGISVEPYRPR